MHLMIVISFDTGGAWEIGSGSLALLVAIAGFVLALLQFLQSRRYKVLTWEKFTDAAIVDVHKDLGQNVQLTLNGLIANYIRLVYVKLTNVGNAVIAQQDYELLSPNPGGGPPIAEHALLIDFGVHKVILYAVHKAEPANVFPQNALHRLLMQTEASKLKLHGVALNSKSTLSVKVLCLRDDIPLDQLANLPDEDRKVKVHVEGQIRDGIIREYIPKPPRITPGRVRIGVSILLAMISLIVSIRVFDIVPIIQGQCWPGLTQDGGSTAFYDTALHEAQIYHSGCILGSINVSQSNSRDGLRDLEMGQLQIANSELSSPYPDQQDHQIAAIVFALIVNKQVTGLTNLDTSQIQHIYNGDYQNWQQVSASTPPLPITVLERPSGSGTLAALIKYILNGKSPQPAQTANVPDTTQAVVSQVAATPGAIGYVALSATAAANDAVSVLEIDGQVPGAASVEAGKYQYWAIEHMYAKPNPDRLVSSFISLVSQDIQTGSTFIRLNDISPAVLQTR